MAGHLVEDYMISSDIVETFRQFDSFWISHSNFVLFWLPEIINAWFLAPVKCKWRPVLGLQLGRSAQLRYRHPANSEASHRVREKTSVIQGKFVLVVIPEQEFRLCGQAYLVTIHYNSQTVLYGKDFIKINLVCSACSVVLTNRGSAVMRVVLVRLSVTHNSAQQLQFFLALKFSYLE